MSDKPWTIHLHGGPADGKTVEVEYLGRCHHVNHPFPGGYRRAVYCWDEWDQEARVVHGSFRHEETVSLRALEEK